MIKIKHTRIFVFAFIVVFVVASGFYFFNKIQSKHDFSVKKKKAFQTKNRYVYTLLDANLNLRTTYVVSITKQDSVIKYNYKSVLNPERNFKMSYNLQHQVLYFGIGDAYLVKRNEIWRDNDDNVFDSYSLLEPEIDGIDLLFNKHYGVLAITSPLGPNHLFLSKINDSLSIKKIEQKIYN
ncbi:hypothetical protein [uncultured Winogradskyella sp.]|uniref:hypothetical protein n=1 Tax=uncultured Winogradskyella sp. TaxID=395353 RepID=UPI0030D73B60